MLTRLLMHLNKVHLATTAREKEALYRFRYTVYVEELQREIGGVDHERKRVFDEEDEKPYSYHFYVGSPQKVAGAVRLRVWEPGRVPEHEYKALSMHLFEGSTPFTTAEIGRYMIRPSRRGALILPSMARRTYDFLAGEKRIDLAFCYCRPGLVNYYRRLGARPYGGNMVDAPEGMEVPLVSVISDRRYYKAMKSPLAPLVRRHFGFGKRSPVDTSGIRHLFNDEASQIVTNRRRVWGEINEQLLSHHHASMSFLDNLPPSAVKKLAESGFIMDIPAGALVTREGHAEREMYVILDGTFEVFHGDNVIAQLGKGDVFGEMAFFRGSGKRVASVRALRGGRLVTLRRKFLDELRHSDPEAAHQILFNLGKILSERLAFSTQRPCATRPLSGTDNSAR